MARDDAGLTRVLGSGQGLETLLPGDGVILAPGDRATVQAVFRCAETIGSTTVTWSWVGFGDGRLLEIAPRGCALYGPPTLFARGSARYLGLVAQDGLLVRFEERVRAGTWAVRPVHLTLQGRRWRVTSTGTVTARRLGDAPPTCWGQLGEPASEGEPTVYFTLSAADSSGAMGLGIWATDVCLAFGRSLGQTPAEAGVRIARTEDMPASGQW